MIHNFVQAFENAWKAPTPENLVALLAPEVVLYQPNKPPITGRDHAYEEFRRLLEWLPGLYGVVERSSGTDELVFIEWQLKIPAGGKTIALRAVDRFLLKEGLASERSVYFDQAVLIKAVLTNPVLWRGFIRYRFGK